MAVSTHDWSSSAISRAKVSASDSPRLPHPAREVEDVHTTVARHQHPPVTHQNPGHLLRNDLDLIHSRPQATLTPTTTP
ncbi:hypothetical protein ACRAWF_25545 [Streptomyces sp. L7]